MKSINPQLSRRHFLQTLGYASSLVAAASLSPSLFASSTEVLAFRQQAPWLPLHYNENALGMSPKALDAAVKAVSELGNRYADEVLDQFSRTLAQHHQVQQQQLIFGNGSTEVISSIITYAASLGAVMVEPTPTFGAARQYAQAHNMPVIKVAVNSRFQVELSELKKVVGKQRNAVLINLCNPNNPTGDIVNHRELAEWILSAPDKHIFLIDEAYFDFALHSTDFQTMLPLIQQGKKNLIVTRTFSKIYGMAGLRMGYGIASADTANQINPFAARFNLNVVGIAAADASLKDQQFYTASLAATNKARQILTDGLQHLSLEYVPSHTNFVLHKITQPLDSFSRRMGLNRIKVGRKMTQSDLWNRMSLGTPQQMEELVKTLKAFRHKGWV